MALSRLDTILEMLKSEPNDSFLNYALALEYGKELLIKKAIATIERLLIHDEKYLGAYYQLGKYYEENKQDTEAITTYKKGIEIAKQQQNRKTEGELNEALFLIED